MDAKKLLFGELIKNGYSKINGNRSWDIADRKFLYITEELAKGFLNLRSFDIYKRQIVDREISLIKENSKKISEQIANEDFNLIDIYCGDGKKAVEFVKSLKTKAKINYTPVSVSKYLLDSAVENIESEKISNVVKCTPILADDGEGQTLGDLFEGLKKKDYNRNVALLMGSVLASYDVNDYLFSLSKSMSGGDYIIIGNGIRSGERLVNLGTYKHPIWNEWFINLMRELGFKDDEVEYDARFGNSRIEMFYRVKKDRKIEIDGKSLEFKKGDELMISFLYKYFAEELEKFCKMYFKEVNFIKDEDEGYSLIICRK